MQKKPVMPAVKFLLPALAFLLPVSMACPALSAPPDKRGQAIALYNTRDYRGAAQLLEDYLATNNRDPYAAYYAALANQQTGNSNKARMYYRLVYSLAPTSQIGIYSRNILLKLDPDFAAAMAKKPAAEGIPSTEQALAKAIVDLPSAEDQIVLDRSVPAECRIPFKKSWNGVNLDGFINGRPMRMKFDTGAPDVVVGKNHLEPLGIALPTGKPDGETGGSASADKVPFWMMKATVKVGPIERRDLPIMVMEHDHSEPLLGQTFFKCYDCSIDESSGQINFRQKALASNQGVSGAAVSVPFEFREAGNRIIVQAEINGKQFPMIFDTGNTANACSFMSVKQAEKAGIKVPPDATITTHYGVNGAGTARAFQINRLRLGPIDRKDVWISVNTDVKDAEGIEAPLLGQPFWEGYEYTIDRKKKLIYFVRR
ncbi:MAG: aspartyl protease family protein [Cyanobacteria bacterium SZAS LIN-3]|nr:aspartyl protease family protein [Cyanobacteria bacterium SZAS LIN-3]